MSSYVWLNVGQAIVMCVAALLVYIWGMRRQEVDTQLGQMRAHLDHIEAEASRRWSKIQGLFGRVDVLDVIQQRQDDEITRLRNSGRGQP